MAVFLVDGRDASLQFVFETGLESTTAVSWLDFVWAYRVNLDCCLYPAFIVKKRSNLQQV